MQVPDGRGGYYRLGHYLAISVVFPLLRPLDALPGACHKL